MDHLLTEARNPDSFRLDELSALEIVQLMNREDAKVIPAVAAEAEQIAKAIDIITERLRRGGRLIYCGAGTSGRLGVLDASECPPTFNSDPDQVVGLIAGGPAALTRAIEGAEDHPEYGEADLRAVNLNAKDVLVGIATSGRTPYVCGALDYARQVGAYAIGFACVPNSELVSRSDLMITPLVGPEVVTGSTRLKSGTATKLILNMLTTGTMVRLGKTFGNLMVDLRATNIKLKARTNRIVRALTDRTVEEAEVLLQQCNGELKTALVVHHAQVSAEEARQRLQQFQGQVRLAIGKELGVAIPATHSEYILGVDGGGTKTVAMLAKPDGTILGKGVSESSNIKAVGLERAMYHVREAIQQAFQQANQPLSCVQVACLGLSGAGRKEDQQEVERWVQQNQLAKIVRVVGDPEIVLSAGSEDDTGIVVIVGTGSIVWGKNAQGKIERSGGWGPLLGDPGSASGMVYDAIRQVLVYHEEGRPNEFQHLLLKRMNLTEPQQLIAAVYQPEWDRTRIASLAPLLFEAAQSGDVFAKEIIDQAAYQIAKQILSVMNRLTPSHPTLPILLTGSVLLQQKDFRQEIIQKLKQSGMLQNPLSNRIVFVDEPVLGAVRIAQQIASRAEKK